MGAAVATRNQSPISAVLLRFREVYAVAPRRVMDKYWHMPWAEVLQAAEDGRDGLGVFVVKEVNGHKVYPERWSGQAGERPPKLPDIAYLTEGQGDFVGKTVLFQQNW